MVVLCIVWFALHGVSAEPVKDEEATDAIKGRAVSLALSFFSIFLDVSFCKLLTNSHTKQLQFDKMWFQPCSLPNTASDIADLHLPTEKSQHHQTLRLFFCTLTREVETCFRYPCSHCCQVSSIQLGRAVYSLAKRTLELALRQILVKSRVLEASRKFAADAHFLDVDIVMGLADNMTDFLN